MRALRGRGKGKSGAEFLPLAISKQPVRSFASHVHTHTHIVGQLVAQTVISLQRKRLHLTDVGGRL